MTIVARGSTLHRNRTQPLGEWRRAYTLAIVNASIFLVMSIFSFASKSGDIGFNILIDLMFFAGSVVSFIAMLRAGGSASALSCYVIGAGTLFGFGTYYSTLSQDWVFQTFFPTSIQSEILPTLNLINSLSVFCVLVAAMPYCWRRNENSGSQTVGRLMESLQPILPLCIAVAIPFIVVSYATFPIPSDPLVGTLLNYAQGAVFFSLLICGARWRQTPTTYKIACAVIAISYALFGLLGSSKTRLLLPEISFLIGLALDNRSRRALLIVAIALLLAYVVLIAPVTNRSRSDPAYMPKNTVAERVQIIGRTFNSVGTTSERLRGSEPLLQRFSQAPMQAFLVRARDNGAPGSSMQDAWVALVPRIVWSGKPNITRFGSDFDALVYRRNGESALAPTYTAEAYWNFGWLGVVLASIIVGFEIGWLTREWNRFLTRGLDHAGVFIFAVPVALFAGWVETWFVATYVGGFATVFVLIKASNYVVPRFIRTVRPQTR